MRDWPWEMWVYFGIGLVIAYWHQYRQGNPEREHALSAQKLVLGILAWIWPVLLFAMLIERMMSTKPNGGPPK